MIEGMMAVAGDPAMPGRRTVRVGPKDAAMRQARTCYDHLAGRVAVAIADAMIARDQLRLDADSGELTPAGARLLADAGIDLPAATATRRRVFCRPCLDWSERRPHVAGLVGAALLDHLRRRAWIRPIAGSRAVAVTPAGQPRLTALFGLAPSLWQTPLA